MPPEIRAQVVRPEERIPAATDFDPPLKRCRLCESTDIHEYDRDYRGVRISRCASCGLKFMNPQYTDTYLEQLYARYNDPTQDQPQTITAGRGELMPAKREGNFALIERWTPVGRLLSIGSGSGDELVTARGRGWSVEGYDVDPVTVSELSNRLGVPVYCGDLTTIPLATAAYDCVYMDQVLEHPKDPAPYLRLSHRILRPGGVLYIGVPNIDSLAASWKTFSGKHHLKPLRGRHYDSWHHLFYYSPTSLRTILEKHFAFDVLYIGGDPVGTAHPTPMQAAADGLRRRFAFLDSSFRVLARLK